MSTQKERWAARADRRLAWAESARAKAEALEAGRNTDHAFMTQPGHIPARARELARADRAMALVAQAAAHAEKARNLQALASRNAGDAERDRQARREAVEWVAGQSVRAVLYGPATVVKVNTKSLRLRLASGNEITEDKSRVRAA